MPHLSMPWPRMLPWGYVIDSWKRSSRDGNPGFTVYQKYPIALPGQGRETVHRGGLCGLKQHRKMTKYYYQIQ